MVRVRKLIIAAAAAAALILSFAAPVRGAAVLTFTSDVGQTVTLTADAPETQTITVVDADGSVGFVLIVSGYGDSDEFDVSVGTTGIVNASLTSAVGGVLSLTFERLPAGAEITVTKAGGFNSVSVVDPSGERVSTTIALAPLADDASVSFSYDELPAPPDAGRVTPLFPGLADENALGGGVTLDATGWSTGTIITLTFHYNAADLVGLDESKLRVHRFTNATGAYEPVGENDRGLGAPTAGVGDYGVDPVAHAAWAVVNQLGSFAVGVTDETLGSGVIDDPGMAPEDGTASPVLCGAIGMINLLLTFLMLAGIRLRRCTPNLN